ncbi:MAG TPA: flagellar filament capping protein FliD, partial [Anaerovoracaceae bacterium]|nr:flagellar filament capping protein FliD [Anaerovoracaceae bacterium]
NAFGGIDAGRVISVNITNDQLSFSAPGSKLTINSIGTDTTTLGSLGLVSGQSNKINLGDSLETTSFSTSLDLTNNAFTFKINAVDFTFNKSDSVSSVINKINSSNAGVNLAYSSITDKFSITTNESGAGDNIVMTESSGNLMTALGLAVSPDPLVSPEVTDGLNALLSVNGQPIIRSSNNIEIDGLEITLTEKSATAITINSIRDSSALVAPIKEFVEDYNTMIEAMNKSIKEEVYRDFPPLSDKQKDDMSETEIKNWDEKAKSGLLRGDTIIRKIASKLQSAMSGCSVNGTYLFNLGITSAGYTENGKLQIDDTKLKSALDSNAAGIKELFTSENGLGDLLNNIINDAVKTSGPQGSRGSLVEAAGIVSTLSESQNYLTDSMTRTNKMIKTLETRLKDEESRLWSRFTAMEQALQRFNNQSSYISQFSAG